jgi:hypothetical protein
MSFYAIWKTIPPDKDQCHDPNGSTGDHFMIGNGGLVEDFENSDFSHSFRATVDAQLFINVVGVPLDGVGGKIEPQTDFPVGQSFCDEVQHLQFTVA